MVESGKVGRGQSHRTLGPGCGGSGEPMNTCRSGDDLIVFMCERLTWLLPGKESGGGWVGGRWGEQRGSYCNSPGDQRHGLVWGCSGSREKGSEGNPLDVGLKEKD